MAYTQLYLAKDIAACLPQPWERYLPDYKNKKDKTATPSQAQRGFHDILKAIGTPARECIERGKPRGRMVGEIQTKRTIHPVIFKEKKEGKKSDKRILSQSEISQLFSDPKRIDELVQLLKTALDKLDIKRSLFSEMLIDST